MYSPLHCHSSFIPFQCLIFSPSKNLAVWHRIAPKYDIKTHKYARVYMVSCYYYFALFYTKTFLPLVPFDHFHPQTLDSPYTLFAPTKHWKSFFQFSPIFLSFIHRIIFNFSIIKYASVYDDTYKAKLIICDSGKKWAWRKLKEEKRNVKIHSYYDYAPYDDTT